MIVVTESLYVGTPEEAAERKDAYFCPTYFDAIHTIAEGATAFIPLDDLWKLKAIAILKNFGASKERIKDAIRFAQTGTFP
jgi:hypothetical protein